MKEKKYEKLLLGSILFYLITTLTYNLWPSFIPVNKLSGFFTSFILVMIILRKVTKKEFIFYLFLFFSFIMSSILTSNFFEHIDDAIYWMVTSLLFIKLLDEDFRNTMFLLINNNSKFIKDIIKLLDFILVIGLLIPTCYLKVWGGAYYVGFTNFPHTLSCGALLLMVLTISTFGEKKVNFSSFFWLIPGTISIFFAGARVYIICLIVLWTIYYIYFLKKASLKIVMFPIIIFVLLYILTKSNMIDKFVNSTNNTYTSTNGIVSFTNGRLDLWDFDITTFFKSNFINILFGNGFDYPYHINQSRFGIKIWSHNDIIDCLLSIGLIGTFFYVVLLIKNMKIILQKVPSILAILILCYFNFVLIINGVFIYQHFIYSFALLYIIISCNPIFKNIGDKK